MVSKLDQIRELREARFERRQMTKPTPTELRDMVTKAGQRGRPRGTVKVDSTNTTQPWKAKGVSRATYFRRKPK